MNLHKMVMWNFILPQKEPSLIISRCVKVPQCPLRGQSAVEPTRAQMSHHALHNVRNYVLVWVATSSSSRTRRPLESGHAHPHA